VRDGKLLVNPLQLPVEEFEKKRGKVKRRWYAGAHKHMYNGVEENLARIPDMCTR
jgi:hypothetical protein